jgi:ring-1,2-phenylacetyl-CoA epoxidase subunit PaaC
MQQPATAPAAADLDADVRGAVHDLILVLADTKRLLGTRYADWILGAPELEAGIACASMAQDEWGHGRLLYALLKDFGADIERIEHGREPGEYRSMEPLDRAPASWPELVVLNAFADTAVSVQLDALRGSTYTPLRQRVDKLLEEERFHAAHGAAWFRRLAGATPAARGQVEDALRALLPPLLVWFGPDSDHAHALLEAGVANAAGTGLRTRFIERVAPLIALVEAGDAFADIEPDFTGFEEASRRCNATGPDAATIARVRGDRNRAFLMD